MTNRAAFALVLCGVLAGCSFTPEDAAEPFAERAIENRIEEATGEDLDLDLDLDNDDGSISIGGNRDGEDFSVRIDPATGEVVIVRGDEERSAQLDLENGSVSIDGADGSSTEIPIPDLESSSAEITDWPGNVPLPGGQVIDVARSQDERQSFLSLSVNPEGNSRAIYERYRDALVADGFEIITESEIDEGAFENFDAHLTRNGETIIMTFLAGEGVELATISLIRPL